MGVKTESVQHPFYLEEGDRMSLRDVGFDLPSDTASHHRQSNIQIVTWLNDKSPERRCRRRMEKISWTDRVRTEEVLHRVEEERNVLHTVERRKANWIGHILCRNCLLKHVIEGKIGGRIEVTGRRGSIRKQLLNNLKENILHTVIRRRANRIGHILCRNCLLKHVSEGKIGGRIEVTGRRGGRRKQLLNNLKEKK
jgi:hypothetical protein